MYHGKHCIKSNKRSGKRVALIASLILLLCVSVGGVVAFLMDTTAPVTNTFEPASVTTYVNETRSGSTKTNVTIQNTGTTDAWIRADVIISWQNDNGQVYGKAPVEGTDYEISWNRTNWLDGSDGFYYYQLPVAPGKDTGVLINSVKPLKDGPAGFGLTVEILGSGIQSSPVSVFNSEWSSSGLTASTSGLS